MIYEHVDFSSLPEDYVKGQEQETGGKAIRSSILRTSKDIHAEAIRVAFSVNQFMLYGARESQNKVTDPMQSKYFLRLFLMKSLPRGHNYWHNGVVPHTFKSRAKFGNYIDYTQPSDDQLKRIKFLAVYITTERKDLIDLWLRETGRTSRPAPILRSLSEHWDDIISFIRRCTILQHLHLSTWLSVEYEFQYQGPRPRPITTPAVLSLMNNLSHIQGVKNLQLFVVFRHCDSNHKPLEMLWDSGCCKEHVLSAKYFRHVVKCMSMPKESELPEFGSGTRIRDVQENRAYSRADQQYFQKPIPEDGQDRMEFTINGWVWDYGYGRNGESYHDSNMNHLVGRRYECNCAEDTYNGFFGFDPARNLSNAESEQGLMRRVILIW